MNKLTHNLAIVSNNRFATTNAPHLHHKEISNALQTSHNFNELIQTFSSKIQHLVPHKGYIYTNPKFNLDILQGTQSRISCSYKLNAEDMSLGELKLMRQAHFDKTEIYLLETLLCYLINPLRNATLFNQALTMAYTDPITQTNNRPAFNESIKREIAIARRYVKPLSLVLVDIDHFKTINDTYGHLYGDKVLLTIADCIKNSIRTCDISARSGGEEFAILLSNTSLKWAVPLSERIRENIAAINLSDNSEQINVTASLGVSCLNDEDTVNTFIYRAQSAMYQAKINGRNQVVAR